MPSEVKFTQDFLEHAAVCTSQYDSTCRAMAAEILALRAEIAKPWEHSDHWRNPETGYIECSCCCDWALDAERDHKRIAELQSQLDAKWISVETAMPEYDTDIVLWAQGWPQVYVGYWRHSHDWIGRQRGESDGPLPDTNPTHWQPLPPPPSGAKGETKP